MAIPFYLAMTAREIAQTTPLPQRVAWMGCQFSPESKGLTNFPPVLPPGAMLTLNDSLPIRDHDPQQIAEELNLVLEGSEWDCVLLDFQRPRNPETAALVRYLADRSPVPLGVSEIYGHDADLPVFLSPIPSDRRLSDSLAPWKSREIWLDMAPMGQTITVTESGASTAPLQSLPEGENCLSDPTLHTHYQIECGQEIRFHLFRTQEDLKILLREAENFPITKAVGLFHELGNPDR